MNEFIIKNRKTLLITITVLLGITLTITFAYFANVIGDEARSNASITSEGTRNFIFSVDKTLSIEASKENFSDAHGSLSDTAIATAELTKGDNEESATEDYYVYFDIKYNDYVYTTADKKPELILQITDPNGNAVTDIDGYTPVTVTDAYTNTTITGYDITELDDLIVIKANYPITTTSTTTQTWTAKITFINLETEQNANQRKTLDANMVLAADDIRFDQAILRHNGGLTAIENNTSKTMGSTIDDYGTTYYQLVYSENDWVKFGGFYWKLVRINGDGTIRLMYTGIEAPLETEKLIKFDIDDIVIESYVYFNSLNDNDNFTAEYTGYMYTIGEQRGLTNDSTAKTIIDTWYEENLINYSEYLADSIFCGDRSAYTDEHATTTTSGIGTESQYFGFITRAIDFNKEENNLICQHKLDSYTVDDTVKGNGALEYPVALMSGDENLFMTSGSYGGSKGNITQPLSALSLLTMSPIVNDVWRDDIYVQGDNQALNSIISLSIGIKRDTEDEAGINIGSFHSAYGAIRPVINLKNDFLISGTGQWNDPYEILE